MRALAAVLAGLATALPAPASVDVVYAQAPPSSVSVSAFAFAWSRASTRLADRFRVFRGASRPSDVLPHSSLLRMFARTPQFGLDVTRSRLLLAEDGRLRIYAAPTRDRRGVCFAVGFQPRCTYALLHGVDPHVDPAGRSAAGSVSGLADDSIVRVDVLFGRSRVRARIGRNAFYLELRPGSPAPTQLVALDRNRRRHVYLVRPCPPQPQALPLAPGALHAPPVQCG
jgi:hypothetical protein